MFRKGTHLLTPEYLEGDYAGEDLRKEVCVFSLPLSFQADGGLVRVAAAGSDGGATAAAAARGRVRAGHGRRDGWEPQHAVRPAGG